MKAERKEDKFNPVIITLESQYEVDLLAELLAIAHHYTTGNDDVYTSVVSEMDDTLEEFCTNSGDFTIFSSPDYNLFLK